MFNHTNPLSTRIRHSLFGFALGDCLGVPYEFQRPGTFRFEPFAGYDTHSQPPGRWSDDTALTLAMRDSISGGEKATIPIQMRRCWGLCSAQIRQFLKNI